MATFTYTPDAPATKSSKPRVDVISFGDGYEQRQAVGVNTMSRQYSLTFNNRDNAEIDLIEAFLEARNATESFDWTPPREIALSKWICREWSRTEQQADVASLTATFIRVYEPTV